MTDLQDKRMLDSGLREQPIDERDLRFGAVVTLPPLETIPNNFTVGRTEVTVDQKNTDLCTAYATTQANEDQERVEFSPDFQFAMTKFIEGNPNSWGATIRDACASLVKYGSLPIVNAEFSWQKQGRGFIADWDNWPEALKQKAILYAKSSYALVSGPYDLFDNMRATLWANRNERRSIVTGLVWRNSWMVAKDGVIPNQGYEDNGTPHAIRIVGVKYIHGEPYLIAPLTSGTRYGDNGVFYLPRVVVNKECSMKWGYYTFIDATPDQIRYLQKKSLTTKSLWWVRIWLIIKKLFLS